MILNFFNNRSRKLIHLKELKALYFDIDCYKMNLSKEAVKYFMENDYLRQYTQWVYLSLDEMYLLYAECLAQTGNLKDAIAQVDVVRSRVGLNSLGKAVPAVKTDKDTFMQQAGQELEDMNTKYNGAKELKLKMELING